MIEHEFRSARVLRRLRKSVFCAAIDDYVTYLIERGHPTSTIHQYVQAVEHFGGWLRRTRRSAERVDERVIERFVHEHLPHCACPPPCCTTVHQVRTSLRHLLCVLRSARRVPTVPSRALSRGETLVRAFEAHLRHERGAAEVTCVYSARYAREFIADCFGDSTPDFSRVRASTITAFLAVRADRWTPASMKVAAVSLRRFFRYLQMIGRIDGRLALAVPTIAGWRLASVPRVLTDQQATALLASFDRSTPIGLRGYATTLCLVRLGLRACEVSALTLDDINWRAGTLTIPATKTRRADVFPLPGAVARAILAYLRRGRPRATTRQIFVRHLKHGATHAGPGIVRVAAREAGARAGLAKGAGNPNVLRHTVATRLLRSGATMKDVADVLRHRSIDTAAIYAKVDIPALLNVATPWPGRSR